MGGWGLQTDASYLKMFDPFPAKMVCRMRYYDQISIDPSAATTVHHLFRANGINDPDQSGTGHQPYGYDTYGLIYNHNRVLRSTIVVKCISAGSDGVWGISRTDDATVSSDQTTNVEQKGTVFDHVHAKYNGTAPSQLTNYFDTKYYVNKNNQDCAWNTNPADPMFFDIWCQGYGLADNPAASAFAVAITYDVLMWELKDLGQS